MLLILEIERASSVRNLRNFIFIHISSLSIKLNSQNSRFLNKYPYLVQAIDTEGTTVLANTDFWRFSILMQVIIIFTLMYSQISSVLTKNLNINNNKRILSYKWSPSFSKNQTIRKYKIVLYATPKRKKRKYPYSYSSTSKITLICFRHDLVD